MCRGEKYFARKFLLFRAYNYTPLQASEKKYNLPKDTKDEFGMCFFIKFADRKMKVVDLYRHFRSDNNHKE